MERERRLIEANALIEKKRQVCSGHGEYDYVVELYHIENAPTVDAVEVVHGRWEDMYGGKYANPRYRCSVCEGKALYHFVTTPLCGYVEAQVLSNYCPNCGAKMVGDRNVADI